MSTIKICDVCEAGLEPKSESMVLRFPPQLAALLPQDKIDVCSTECLRGAATIVESVLNEAGLGPDPVEGDNQDDETEEPPLIPQSNTRLDDDLQPRFSGPVNVAGVTERGGLS